MRSIEFNQGTEASSPEDDTSSPCTSWDCTICGRARLCPYAAPCLSDAREACLSCGDLLAHVGNHPAGGAVSNLAVW